MAHIHEDSETYYLDQLCLVALSGAFGGMCLSLYFWKQDMLGLMLGTQFHPWVLASGIALVLMAAIRAGILWKSAGKRDAEHDHEHQHDHEHAHEHDHDHAHCDDHGHDHHHDHEHGHHHHHHHGHDHAGHDHDHDHDWAPWRYVILLLPIMLFLLGLPNKGPQVRAGDTHVDMREESIGYATLIGTGVAPLNQLVLAAGLVAEGNDSWIPLDFKDLEDATKGLEDEGQRATILEELQGKRVRIKGQFAPSRANDRVFSLVRFRIRCCAADAIPLNVPMICKESLRPLQASFKPDQWVEVTGRLDFQRGPKGFQTIMHVPNLRSIVPTDPDVNPWVRN